MLVLAIDIGSSSVKAALLRDEKLVKSSKAEFPTRYGDGRAEVNTADITAAMAKAVRLLGGGVKRVDIIAPTFMAPSWVAMDARGRAITPVVTHQDRRSIDIAHEIERRIGKQRHLKLAGNRPFPGGLSSTTAAWFIRNEKSLMKRCDLIGHVSTFMLRQWTGNRLTDPSNASFMGVFNTPTLSGWNDELCEIVGVSKGWLPEVRDANRLAGTLQPGVASQLGLREGLPVLTGCMDTSAAIIAVGAKNGHLLNSCGSTDVLAVCTNAARPHERLLTRGLGIDGKFTSVYTIGAAGSSVTWAHKTLFADLSAKKFFAMLARLPDAGGVSFDPYLAGDRMALEQKLAGFRGLSLSTTREQMLSAILDAIAKESAERLPLLRQVTKLHHTVTITGGGAESDIFHRDWGRGWRFIRRERLTTLGLAKLAAMAT